MGPFKIFLNSGFFWFLLFVLPFHEDLFCILEICSVFEFYLFLFINIKFDLGYIYVPEICS